MNVANPLLLRRGAFGAVIVEPAESRYRDPDSGKNKVFAAIRGIELPLSILAVMIALALMGGGRFSLDALIAARRKSVRPASAGQTG